MVATSNWLNHEFQVYQPPVNWKDVAGVYIFCGINQEDRWVPLYIGQASSLAERLATHERWPEAKRLGASYIHVRVVPRQQARDSLERMLIREFQPRLNVQLKQSPISHQEEPG